MFTDAGIAAKKMEHSFHQVSLLIKSSSCHTHWVGKKKIIPCRYLQHGLVFHSGSSMRMCHCYCLRDSQKFTHVYHPRSLRWYDILSRIHKIIITSIKCEKCWNRCELCLQTSSFSSKETCRHSSTSFISQLTNNNICTSNW